MCDKNLFFPARFRLRYSNTCNSYYRDWFDAIDPSAQGVITGWDKALYSVDSVRRHINEDIGQVIMETCESYWAESRNMVRSRYS